MRTVDPAKTAERRRQILDAALACFKEKGFQGAAMSAICKKAKMSPGHLYHYFSGKEDLIEAIAEKDSYFKQEKIASMVASGNTLDAMLERVSEIWSHEDAMQGALYSEVLAEATRNPRIATIIRGHEGKLRTLLAEAISNGQERGQIDTAIDPQGFATLIIGVVNGLSLSDDANTGIDRESAETAVKLMLNRCLRPNA